MKSKLLRQPETTQSQPPTKQEIKAATSTEIQEKNEEDQEIKHKIASHFSKEELDEDAKFEENLDLYLECSNSEATNSSVEENAITGADTMKEGGNWFQIGNKDDNAMNEGGVTESTGVLRDGAIATQEGELRVTIRPMVEASSFVGVLRRGWLRHASPIVVQPLPLLAATLWNCEREATLDDGMGEQRQVPPPLVFSNDAKSDGSSGTRFGDRRREEQIMRQAAMTSNFKVFSMTPFLESHRKLLEHMRVSLR
ncbi:hypothetical protein PIB30_019947 [Stylosanthes scabra]|uniref:Uncharacterized protein n=1 Tax=Stylosanthes scabra TaxID=79078 RepID=A0ABU6WAD8_9FABA|nr:hypothetical protein [Stylosanthes scabra]